ncbi:MAG: hemerythrin domain-containing protein [Myxococcales bacterium]|nr:hemerythrin domain-containing protein [Myxococcales bacterium]
MSKGPEIRIVHDHDHQAALLSDLESALAAWSEERPLEEGDDTPPLQAAREIISLLKEDTFEHFEAEEHGLFPNLRSDFPEVGAELDELHSAHDDISRQLELIERMLLDLPFDAAPERRAEAVAAVKRLGQLSWHHTAVEWGLIRRLLERLDEGRRAEIMKQIQEI